MKMHNILKLYVVENYRRWEERKSKLIYSIGSYVTTNISQQYGYIELYSLLPV